ncbi:MAG: RluA family pseudouridine synthase [Puniceicoccales bacterium]|nr:RluA family pseudouridine synthase [Puniceicoccales bacterium]
MFFFEIPAHCDGMRLDIALVNCFPQMSRTAIRRACDGKLVLCNASPLAAKTKVREGQVLQIQWVDQKEITLRRRQEDLIILYEDEFMLAIHKPSGAVVHPGHHACDSIVEVVLHHTNGQLARAAGVNRPGVVHRLDRETSGVLLFAKTDAAYRELSRMFSEHWLEKYYEALSMGRLPGRCGVIKEPIGRDPLHRTRMAVRRNGRHAHSEWRCIQQFSHGVSLLSVRIHTGRTHQIRVHLSHIHCPVLGDKIYGFRKELLPHISVSRIMLHGSHLAFIHPFTKEPLHIHAPRPQDMQSIISQMQCI